MNYSLQLHGERCLYEAPPGLYELMSDISREVLREQPGRLYEHIAHYLETLIKVRECATSAAEVVADSLDENLEMLAYIGSLGTTWEAANSAARKIQNAARRFRSAKEMKLLLEIQKEKKAVAEFYLTSKAFRDYMETITVDFENASRASSIMLAAYKEFIAREEEGDELRSEASIHTIEKISPIVSGEAKKTRGKRDSTILVYQQTPKHSIESSWSTLATQLAEEEGKQIRPYTLVYEGEADERSEETAPTPPLAQGLPDYLGEDQSEVPMIEQTGELADDKDIVTLLSADSVNQRYFSGNGVELVTSFSNVSLPSLDPDKSKELFDILERKYSESTPKSSLLTSQKQEEDKGSQSGTKRASLTAKIEPERVQDPGEAHDSRTTNKSGSNSSSKHKSVRIEVPEKGIGSQSSAKKEAGGE